MAVSTIHPSARMESIQKKAYELYVERGMTSGHELEDWLAAEKMVDRELKDSQPRSEPAGQRSPFASARVTPSMVGGSAPSGRR